VKYNYNKTRVHQNQKINCSSFGSKKSFIPINMGSCYSKSENGWSFGQNFLKIFCLKRKKHNIPPACIDLSYLLFLLPLATSIAHTDHLRLVFLHHIKPRGGGTTRAFPFHQHLLPHFRQASSLSVLPPQPPSVEPPSTPLAAGALPRTSLPRLAPCSASVGPTSPVHPSNFGESRIFFGAGTPTPPPILSFFASLHRLRRGQPHL
jgi:hypothetical protein